jgi:hypothetical protein
MEESVHGLWADLYSELTEADDGDSRADEFTRRAAPYCRRVAALHAVLDGRPIVNAGDLEAAAALIRYSTATAHFVLQSVSGDARLDRIRRAVIDAGGDGLSRTEISGLFSRNLAADVLNELLDRLLEDHDFELAERPTAGRTATHYRRKQKR